MPVIELDAVNQRGAIPDHTRRLMSGQDLLFETVHVRKDGTEFPVEVSAKLLHIAGKPHIFAIERDITERKQAEQEKERLNAQLMQAQKLESLGVLTGGIAHDFNNLLMGMVGNADLLLKNLSVGDPMRRRVEDVNTAARQAKDLVRQMLSYAGGERFEVVPIDLHDLVEEMVSLLQAALPKTATLELCAETRVPAVEADPSQLRQVVMNVITNASESLGEQGGTIRIRVGTKDYDAAAFKLICLGKDLLGGRYVFLEVADEGAGMTPIPWSESSIPSSRPSSRAAVSAWPRSWGSSGAIAAPCPSPASPGRGPPSPCSCLPATGTSPRATPPTSSSPGAGGVGCSWSTTRRRSGGSLGACCAGSASRSPSPPTGSGRGRPSRLIPSASIWCSWTPPCPAWEDGAAWTPC